MRLILLKQKILIENVFILAGKPSWSLDFYTSRITPVVAINDISKTLKNGDWLFLYDYQLKQLNKDTISWSEKYEINHFRITRVSGSFINPNTRDGVLEKAFLLKYLPKQVEDITHIS